MNARLHARLAKLEAKCDASKSANRVITYNPKKETAEQALQRAGSGSYMLVPTFGTNDEWRRASIEQQAALHKLGVGH